MILDWLLFIAFWFCVGLLIGWWLNKIQERRDRANDDLLN